MENIINPIVKQLAEQAEDYVNDTVKRSGFWSNESIITLRREKFASLILEECMSVIKGGRFLHDQAPTALFAKECTDAIKRHFELNGKR